MDFIEAFIYTPTPRWVKDETGMMMSCLIGFGEKENEIKVSHCPWFNKWDVYEKCPVPLVKLSIQVIVPIFTCCESTYQFFPVHVLLENDLTQFSEDATCA